MITSPTFMSTRMSCMGRLDDKIAIVTGAGQGIGQAIAGKLARAA